MNGPGSIASWETNPLEIGPMYPFVGWEVAMFIACVAFCLAFTIWKFVSEHRHYMTKARELRESGELERIFPAPPKKNMETTNGR